MKENKRKNLIIVIIILLIVLIGAGIIMVLAQSDDKANTGSKKEKENNRCVDKLCISKVTTEDNNGSETLAITIKNEGTETIKEKCVKLSSKENSFDICITELLPDAEMLMGFSKKEIAGEDINDFKLEKIVEKQNTTPTTSPEVTE